MKEKKDFLIGRTVMVHPDITADPWGKRGRTGVVTGFLPGKKAAYVRFEDGSSGLYADDTLLTLPSLKAILHAIHVNGRTLDEKGHELIMQVFKLAMQHKHADALKLAVKDEKVAKLCTINCFDYREQKELLQTGKGLKR
ncbi:hypothetical protein VRU48_14805 [Pedobacter sp. KR3-3]|uniref:DUF4314 domain-containing protein n=1 Tax=Pedobacter albus TaxID=3113905 RepID=A0ABU7IAT6_9SPHI|nr:hypothetical protein [Pedobacter sp. KR3-3]MEE1946391.1 hypothetical protein [Pedobacter sp. KR3-3]